MRSKCYGDERRKHIKLFIIVILSFMLGTPAIGAEGTNKTLMRNPSVEIAVPRTSISNVSAQTTSNALAQGTSQTTTSTSNIVIPSGQHKFLYNYDLWNIVLQFSRIIFAVLLLAFLLAIIFILLRLIKKMNALKSGESQLNSQESKTSEPTNVSEAVASFIKHRLKKH